MSFGVVSSGARSPTARGGRLCRADASPEAGLIRCYATASAVKRKMWCSGVRGWETVTWCFSICAPLMHSALPFYSFWPVSKSGGGIRAEDCVRCRISSPLLPYRYKALVEGHLCLCDQILRARRSPASVYTLAGLSPYPKVFTCSSWTGKVDYTAQRYTVAVPPAPYCEPMYTLLAREISPSITLGAR